MFSNKQLVFSAVIILCLMHCLWIDAATPKASEAYKKNFGRKLRRCINAQMAEFIQDISPCWTNYIKSIIADLPPNDEHTQKLRYYLSIRDNLIRDVEIQKSQKRKVNLVKTMRKYRKCFDTIKNVNDINTPELRAREFRRILAKHDLGKVEHKLTKELITYLKNVYREWMVLYSAIPEEYLRMYPQFKTIDDSWQKMMSRPDFQEQSKILLTIDYEISKFFGYDNFLKVYF